MNFVDAALIADNGGIGVRLSDGTVLGLPSTRMQRLAGRNDGAIVLGVRPEHISRRRQRTARRGQAPAQIDLVQPTGARTYATFQLGGTAVVAELQAHDVSQPGEQVDLAIDMNRAVLIDPSSEHVVS
jgi:multiple sugar transport system ATP-binding protein